MRCIEVNITAPICLQRCSFKFSTFNTVKPLNSGHLRVFKNLSFIKRCPLLGGHLTKIVTFGTRHFIRYSKYFRYCEVSLYSYLPLPVPVRQPQSNKKTYRNPKSTKFITIRSSRPEVFCKKGIHKSFAKFTEIHLWQSIFNKDAGLRPGTLLKKRL